MPDEQPVWPAKYPESFGRSAEGQRRYTLHLKLKIFKIFGNRCVRCGITDHRCLQLDHIDGQGSTRELNLGKAFYLRILRNLEEYKKILQLLCANCNWIKRYERKETRWNPLPNPTRELR